MGASQYPAGSPRPAAMLSSVGPEIRVENASDENEETAVFLEGTMFHDGLNRNAWGLSEAGAEAIADDLVGRDHVMHHPHIRNGKYDRSMTDGPGFPIGKVVSADVEKVDQAMVDGGEYTAAYTTEITDPVYKARYAAGQYDGEDYSVSVGIYGDPDSAACSVCSEPMGADDCGHSRGEEVEVEADDGETQTKVAGPVYDNGQGDHLASVYMAAYEGADADVSTAAADDGGLDNTPSGASDVPLAASVLAEPFDQTETASETPDETTDDDSSDDDGYPVELDTEPRSSFKVKL